MPGACDRRRLRHRRGGGHVLGAVPAMPWGRHRGRTPALLSGTLSPRLKTKSARGFLFCLALAYRPAPSPHALGGAGAGLPRPIRRRRAVPRSTIDGVITPQVPRRARRHGKKLRNPLRSGALLAIAAAVGLALIVTITVPAVLGATTLRHGGKPTPTATITVPQPRPTVTVTAPRPTVTVTAPRPGPTVTVTELQPGPTVTVRCHPGRPCHGD